MGKIIRGMIYAAMFCAPLIYYTQGTDFSFLWDWASHGAPLFGSTIGLLGIISGLGGILFLGWTITLLLSLTGRHPEHDS